MSFFPHASSRRGASVLAALVFIVLVGLIAGGLQTLAPKAPSQSQLGTPTPPASSERPKDEEIANCKPGERPGTKSCSCNQKETRSSEGIIEACLPGCTYQVKNVAEKDAKPRTEIVPTDPKAYSSSFLDTINKREDLSYQQKNGGVDQCTMRICNAKGDECKNAKYSSGESVKSALAPEVQKDLEQSQKDLEAAKKAKEDTEKKVREAQEKWARATGCTTNLAPEGQCTANLETTNELRKLGVSCTEKLGIGFGEREFNCNNTQFAKVEESLRGDLNSAKSVAATAALEQQRLEQRVNDLRGQVAGFEAMGGPVNNPGIGATPCAGTNCPPNGPPDRSPRGPSDGPPGPPNTFGDPQPMGGGMGSGLGGAMGGIGGALARMFGGGQQRPPQQQNPYGQNPYNQQMCPTSYQCQGNTLIYRTPQCQQQPMQQCQYGCDQTGTMCAQQPAPYGKGTDGQPCPQPPTKPDNSQCSAGVWQSLSATNNGCVTGWKCSVTDSPTAPKAEIACTPQVADVGATVSIQYSCSAGSVTATGFTVASSTLSGTATAIVPAPAQGSNLATFGISCAKDGLTAGAQCNVQVARPSIVLVANPKKVKAGETATVGWVTSGMRSCVISSPDSSAFTDANKNNTSINGVAQTPTIHSPMTIRIVCETLGGSTRSAETRIEVE